MEKMNVMEELILVYLISMETELKKFTFHVVSLPHTQTTLDYSHCAYTDKVRKFCNMMKSLGHTVYQYASEDSDADCDELITCITKEQQKHFFGEYDHTKEFFNITWNENDLHWIEMNRNAINAIKDRVKERDFICLIGGTCQKQIADAFPAHNVVEFGVGYRGVFSNFRVFESYAWMHYVYGVTGQDDGRFFDCVIPNYFEVENFPDLKMERKYCLYLGRLVRRKGIELAVEATKRAGVKLILAGQGVEKIEGRKIIAKEITIDEDHVTHVGYADVKKRAELFNGAICTFVPTFYIEPFGGVSIESLLCGTPVIASDFGAFPENIRDGADGFKYRTVGEAVDGIKHLYLLNSEEIRKRAQTNFGTDRVRMMYQAYFEQLYELWDNNGWYSDWSGLNYARYARF